MDKDNTPQHVKCPQCGRLALYAPQNPARPFCSERCKIIDLGGWASEKYRLPPSPTESLKDLEDLEGQEDSEDYEA